MRNTNRTRKSVNSIDLSQQFGSRGWLKRHIGLVDTKNEKEERRNTKNEEELFYKHNEKNIKERDKTLLLHEEIIFVYTKYERKIQRFNH